MPIDEQYIFSWLQTPGIEGSLECRGYVPCRNRNKNKKGRNYRGDGDYSDLVPVGASGVTIGVGVDLGQTSADFLRKAGVPEAVIFQLTPYFGLSKQLALEALQRRPLTLTREDAQELTDCLHRRYLHTLVIPWWNKKGGLKFEELPTQAQTALFSLAYQCGCAGADRRGPNTIKAALKGDWCRAAACLMDRNGWNGEYVNRRYMEGLLMKELCQ